MIEVNISNSNETFESVTCVDDQTGATVQNDETIEHNVSGSEKAADNTKETLDEFQLPNFSVPPPKFNIPPPSTKPTFFRPYHLRPNGMLGSQSNVSTVTAGQVALAANLDDFDGKRLRKSVMRKTVDYNSSIIRALESRIWNRDFRDRRALQPDVLYYPDLLPPPSYVDNPMTCITTRYVKTATNKIRCPIFCMAWTPEGRRLVTGASSGEFTLWNGLTFNFETILQAHDTPVRSMVWSHNDNWMVTGDHAGYVKYWQSNMNNVKMFQAHKEALRGISFSPLDSKFVTCSDDGTLRLWDFFRCTEERVMRGHGADVKCVHWHPQKALIVSGSKDNQQPIKLWDPKSGNSVATIHAHKATVMDLKWNDNGNWLVTASRDHLLKLFDIRQLNQEVQTFRGHKKEASIVIWHPVHEGLFVSGGSDGSVMFWNVGTDKEVGSIEQAHDSIVWTMAWHPLGHILCTGSNDHSSKFWTRNRPGDQMRDKYNLNILPAGVIGVEDVDIDELSVIPGMDLNTSSNLNVKSEPNANHDADYDDATSAISDNNESIGDNEEERHYRSKKMPYCKPIPRSFQSNWNSMSSDANSRLHNAIADGSESLNRLIMSGEIEDVNHLPYDDNIKDYRESEPESATFQSDYDHWAPDPESLRQPYGPPLDEDLRFWNGPKDYQNSMKNNQQPPSLLNLNFAPPHMNGSRFPAFPAYPTRNPRPPLPPMPPHASSPHPLDTTPLQPYRMPHYPPPRPRFPNPFQNRPSYPYPNDPSW